MAVTPRQLWTALGVVFLGYIGLVGLMGFGFAVLREDTSNMEARLTKQIATMKTDLSADIGDLEASFDKLHPRMAKQ